jgi:dTDP-4-dehydrorhamnose 3,5-epimerase
MLFTETKLRGAFIVEIERHEDERGYFARTFCQRELTEHGLNASIAQVNIAFNRRKGTLRGMHFQYPPSAEWKFVRATRGAVLDIIVDLRPESPTYLEHVGVELSVDNHCALYIPERFAHGYQTIENGTETTYYMGEFYAPEAEGGLPYDDPALRLEWPLEVSVVSNRDRGWAPLAVVEADLRSRMTCHLAAAHDPQ